VTDLLKFLIESESDPLNAIFSDNLTLDGEDSNNFYPGILQCVSEIDVQLTLSSILAVYNKLRTTCDQKQAMHLLATHPRYSGHYLLEMPDDMRVILSDPSLPMESRMGVLRYALVRT
jgi:hypothetical protein